MDNNSTAWEKAVFVSEQTETGSVFYIDAWGESWDSDYFVGDNYRIWVKPSILMFMTLVHGTGAREQPKTKRWYQELWIDVEWSSL